MRPRYKVAYKMVTEMEWKCCHGYSGEDCNDGPNGGSDTQISTSRPWPRPQPGQTGTNTVMDRVEGMVSQCFLKVIRLCCNLFKKNLTICCTKKSLADCF